MTRSTWACRSRDRRNTSGGEPARVSLASRWVTSLKAARRRGTDWAARTDSSAGASMPASTVSTPRLPELRVIEAVVTGRRM